MAEKAANIIDSGYPVIMVMGQSCKEAPPEVALHVPQEVLLGMTAHDHDYSRVAAIDDVNTNATEWHSLVASTQCIHAATAGKWHTRGMSL
eukprot:8074154-Pyramimonas_sp.AAC.1